MSDPRPLRLAPSPALKERRLATLLAGADPRQPALLRAVAEAQARGSLELAGLPASEEAVAGLLRAQAAVPEGAGLTLDALRRWQAALTGGSGAFRRQEAARPDGPPPAPARFVEDRMRIVEHWLQMESGRELRASQQGALVMARIVEIRPFDDANGRVARLAASHLMVRAGARPPVLGGEDGPRLREALAAAFQLHTEPLCALLDEASERAVDVMIRALERREPAP